MENFSIDVLSDQIILDHFIFINSDDDSNECFELSTYLINQHSAKTIICFETMEGKISNQ